MSDSAPARAPGSQYGRFLAPLALLAFSCCGCLMAPIPTTEHQRDDLPGRTNITPEVIEGLRPGITTRQEVLARLGTPDGVFERERTFVYLWSKCAGYFTWFIYGYVAGGSAGAAPVGKGYALIIEFDAAGAFQRQRIVSKNNWTDWAGPSVDRTHFPEAILNPTAAPLPSSGGK